MRPVGTCEMSVYFNWEIQHPSAESVIHKTLHNISSSDVSECSVNSSLTSPDPSQDNSADTNSFDALSCSTPKAKSFISQRQTNGLSWAPMYRASWRRKRMYGKRWILSSPTSFLPVRPDLSLISTTPRLYQLTLNTKSLGKTKRTGMVGCW